MLHIRVQKQSICGCRPDGNRSAVAGVGGELIGPLLEVSGHVENDMNSAECIYDGEIRAVRRQPDDRAIRQCGRILIEVDRRDVRLRSAGRPERQPTRCARVRDRDVQRDCLRG
jgi:hypothetical protein